MAVFVGRQRELRTLVAAVEAAVDGTTGVCFITGEPGIGKTSLATELTAEADGRGCAVLWGRCWEGPGAPALWPWRQILDEDHALPVPADRLETDDDRFVVYEEVTAQLRAKASVKPTVVVLDDLHWADQLSLRVLQFAAQHLRRVPLLIVGTYRDAEARLGSETGVLAQLARHATAVPLRGLSTGEIETLVREAHGTTLASETLQALEEATAGNPFFLDEVMRLRIAEVAAGLHTPHGTPERFDAREVPDGVRDAIRKRLDLVDPDTRGLLATAAVVGRDFSVAVLHGVTGAPRAELLAQLDAATAAGLVTTTDSTYRFTHALVRETLYADVEPGALLDVHRRVATALERFYGADLDAHAAELAHHFAAAQSPRDAVRAATYDLTAGYEAVRRFAYELAVDHAQHGLGALAAMPDPDLRLRADLHLLEAEAHLRLSDPAALKQAASRAAADARAAGSNEHLARAAIAYGSMAAAWAADPDGVALCESALDAVGATRADLRARLLCSLTWMYVTAGDLDEADRPSERALELARQLDEPATLCRALYVRQEVLFGTAAARDQLRLADELVAVAERHGDVYWRAQGYRCRAVARLQLSDVRGFRADAETMTRLASTLRSRIHASLGHSWRGVLALLDGRFDEVETHANRALATLQADPDALKAYASQLFWLRHEQGRLSEMVQMVDAAIEQEPALSAVRAVAAHLHAEVGDPDAAGRHLAELLRLGLHKISRDWGWSMVMTSVASVLARRWLDGPDDDDDAQREVASTLAELLEPFRDQLVVVASATHVAGAFDRYRAIALSVLGRWNEAEPAFTAALRLEAAIGARPLAARTRFWYACMLVARDAEGDKQQARDLLIRSTEDARGCGMMRLADEAEKLYACM